jgi:hypothetical protein
MEARLAHASIDVFNEPNHLCDTLTPRNQKAGYVLTNAARTRMVVEVERNNRSTNSVESDRYRTVVPFQVETGLSSPAFK